MFCAETLPKSLISKYTLSRLQPARRPKKNQLLHSTEEANSQSEFSQLNFLFQNSFQNVYNIQDRIQNYYTRLKKKKEENDPYQREKVIHGK